MTALFSQSRSVVSAIDPILKFAAEKAPAIYAAKRKVRDRQMLSDLNTKPRATDGVGTHFHTVVGLKVAFTETAVFSPRTTTMPEAYYSRQQRAEEGHESQHQYLLDLHQTEILTLGEVGGEGKTLIVEMDLTTHFLCTVLVFDTTGSCILQRPIALPRVEFSNALAKIAADKALIMQEVPEHVILRKKYQADVEKRTRLLETRPVAEDGAMLPSSNPYAIDLGQSELDRATAQLTEVMEMLSEKQSRDGRPCRQGDELEEGVRSTAKLVAQVLVESVQLGHLCHELEQSTYTMERMLSTRYQSKGDRGLETLGKVACIVEGQNMCNTALSRIQRLQEQLDEKCGPMMELSKRLGEGNATL